MGNLRPKICSLALVAAAWAVAAGSAYARIPPGESLPPVISAFDAERFMAGGLEGPAPFGAECRPNFFPAAAAIDPFACSGPLPIDPDGPPPVVVILPPDERTTQNVMPLPPVVPLPRLWESSFELGMSGSEGNAPTFDFHVGFHTKRKTPNYVFKVDLDYFKKTNRYVETMNRAFGETRLDRLYAGTPWKSFARGTLEYDEFKPFDTRIAGDLGVGRQLIDDDFTALTARLGTGVSHEIGGPNDTWAPEAVFGLDFEHRVGSRQKFCVTFDYLPDMTEFNEYRLRTNANWEVLVSDETNLSLKFTVLDRYDSTLEGSKANDLDYSAAILWKF